MQCLLLSKASKKLVHGADNSIITVYLDGKLVGSKAHHDPKRHTGSGFILGGFADCNRAYVGHLSGVRLYMDCLDAAAINAVRAASMPSGLPPPPPPTPTKTCLYRGPLLLTYDPRFNGLERQDTAAAPFRASGFAQPPTRVTPADADRLPCNLLLEFATAGAGGKPVRLCDFGSAGMTGRFFTSWLTLDYGKRAPTAPFSQAAPTRTFVLAEHC